MNRLRARAFRDLEDYVAAQIALRRRCGSDADGLIRQLHVHRTRVRFRINGNRANTQSSAVR